MRVLVACEFSGIVRDAFRSRGHDAWSCDLLSTEREGPHIQGDVLRHLDDGWDLVIAHPPCTDLAVSGARYFEEKRKSGAQQKSIEFFMAFTKLRCKWAIENPIGIMSRLYRKPDQIIQPWQFGHPESKATCLWLSGLPLLQPTKILRKPAAWVKCPDCDDYWCTIHGLHAYDCLCPDIDTWVAQKGTLPYEEGTGRWSNQTPSGQNKLGPSPGRWKLRSATYQGIASAMAEQWDKEV
jgi:hypothetical protein